MSIVENVISVENITKRYGEKLLFDPISFGINKSEKIGVLGINGCGKSTLLKMLAGIEHQDGGQITFQSNIRIGYLPQSPNLHESLSIIQQIYMTDHPHFQLLNKYYRYSEALEFDYREDIFEKQNKVLAEIERNDAWSIDYKAKATLTKFGLNDWQKRIGELSGGQKRKVDLVRVLLDEPDIILMDEPTNHLDTDIIEYIQEWMINSKATILFVTHDRYFLDAVSTKILEIDQEKIRFYPGSYSAYVERKQLELVDQERKETRRQAQLKKELKWLNRGARARATKPKDHVERVKELIDKSYLSSQKELSMSFQTARLGKTILEINDLSFGYEKALLTGFTYFFQKNDRIGIIGPNGCGKSSLIKAILGDIPIISGSVKFGLNTKVARLDQEEPMLNPKLKVVDYIKESTENIRTQDGVLRSSEQILERFLFDRKMQQAPISYLSGGEKKRLYLLQSLLFGSNFLVLDEPTNDLDIRTLEILEDYLDNYEGCIVLISHDRYILDRIVDYLFIFQEDNSIRMFPGNYSDYLLVKKYEAEETEEKKSNANKKQAIKPKTIKKLSYKEERELEQIEEKIEVLEQEKTAINNRMQSDANSLNHEDYAKLSKELGDIENEVLVLLERWEALETKRKD
ncbi:MAG TPA: ABC-F family ATP-binding cassette domain-containing protein [Candidatus Cloacimonadota bacterium]|nr:ABC-F family ATP-binding cassette domain-containing protein [Candidatus Cloacimonadota bacterium]HQB41455.1 ABC-F family ATP-binding cassette domain-containing protein [Candidatus Cloacimonadota bacterium]